MAAQFIAESTLKLLLAVPVLGGIFLVALLMDADVGELISGSPSEIVQAVFNAMAPARRRWSPSSPRSCS